MSVINWGDALWPIIGLGICYLIGVGLVKKNEHQQKLWKKNPEELKKIDGLFVKRPKNDP